MANDIIVWQGWIRLWGEAIDEVTAEAYCTLTAEQLDGDKVIVLQHLRTRTRLLDTPARSQWRESKMPIRTAEELWRPIHNQLNQYSKAITIYRMLEVLEHGNSLGLWTISINKMVLPKVVEEPSPLTTHQQQSWVQLQQLQQRFIDSLQQWRPWQQPAVHWGAILWSALLYGGLLQTRALIALPRYQQRQEHWHWVELELWPERVGEEKYRSQLRWLPDPLTRTLLLDWSHHNPGYMLTMTEANTAAAQLQRLLRGWKQHSGLHSPFRTLSELRNSVYAQQATQLPGYINGYSAGKIDTTCLPTTIWQRLLHPPQQLRWTPVAKPTPQRDDNPAEAIEVPEQTVAELTRVIAAIRPHITSGNTIAARIAVNNLPATRLASVQWLRQFAVWLLTGATMRKALAPKTVQTYLYALGVPISGALGDSNPQQLTEADWCELLSDILADRPTPQSRRQYISATGRWLDWLETQKEMQRPDCALPRGERLGLQLVNANIVGITTLNLVLHYITDTSLYWLLVLAWSNGLRRGEVVWVRYCDIYLSPQYDSDNIPLAADLELVPHRQHRQKSNNSLRTLPLQILMLPEHYRGFCRWYQQQPSDNPERPLFAYSPYGRDINQLVDLLRRAAHDASINFHHLRHSCANRLLWALTETQPQQQPAWMARMRSELALSPQWRRQLMGRAENIRGALYMVARIMGHAHPDTTLLSYIHILDVLQGQHIRSNVPKLSPQLLQQLTLLNDNQRRKIAKLPHTEQLDQAIQTRWAHSVGVVLPSAESTTEQLYEQLLHQAWQWQQASAIPPIHTVQLRLLQLPENSSESRNGVSRPQGEESEAFLLSLCQRYTQLQQQQIQTTQQRGVWYPLLQAWQLWIPEQPAVRWLITLPDAKRWKILTESLVPQAKPQWQHLANPKTSNLPIPKQRSYWQEKLAVPLLGEANIKWTQPETLPARGVLLWQIRDRDGLTRTQRALLRWFLVMLSIVIKQE